MKIRSRYHARRDLIHRIKEELRRTCEEYGELLQHKTRVEVLETELGRFIMIDGSVLIFETEDGYFPTVRGALLLENKRRFVTVDRGAVEYIGRGADVMRPGVVDYDPEIKKGDYVVVKEETHGKPLAIGRALWDGEEFTTKREGKCVESIHHVGDEIWRLG